MPTDFHLVHLGGKALGGAGLVMTEMVCVSPQGRITPGCTGIWDDAQAAAPGRGSPTSSTPRARRRSACSSATPAARARPSSCGRAWTSRSSEGNWEVIAPSPLPYQPGVNQVPREMTRGRPGAGARPSSSTPPGVPTPRRLRPARAALRARLPALLVPLPADQPAHRRVRRQPREPAALPARGLRRHARGVAGAQAPDGRASRPPTGSRAASTWTTRCEIAQAFQDAGAAAIDVSTGQVTPDERPRSAGRTRRRSPTRSATGSASRPSPSAIISLLGRRQLHRPGRARRPLRGRPSPPLRPQLDPARRGRAGLRRARGAVADALARRPPQAADRPQRRPQAAPAAGPRGRRRHPSRQVAPA